MRRVVHWVMLSRVLCIFPTSGNLTDSTPFTGNFSWVPVFSRPGRPSNRSSGAESRWKSMWLPANLKEDLIMKKSLFDCLWIILTCAAISAFCASALKGPMTPEQALASFKTEPGLRVELVAAEPDVISPVAMAFDEKGRMFVVEDIGYPVGPGKGKPPVGRVLLFESTKGDGHYDKHTVYADKLTFPNGVMPWKG